MERRGFIIGMSVILSVIMVLAGILMRQNRRLEPDVTYTYVNQRIEWTGAGYSGIYGGTHGR